MISYGKQTLDESDVEAVAAVLRTGPLTTGPWVEKLESDLALVTGARRAVVVSNGTSALRLLYRAAGVGPGTTVGVPAITFVATASQAMALGARVVLLDVDPSTGLLTPDILEACPHKLDFVVPVHMGGLLCDMPGLAAVAALKGAVVLEDAAHAVGSTRADGTGPGDERYSQGATLSFHPVKNITTGEGGAILVSRADWAEKLRSLRHHGIERTARVGTLATVDGGAPWYHEFHEPASNERLPDILAALGISQLRRLGAFKQRRQEIVDAYRTQCGDLSFLRFVDAPPGQSPCWHLCSGLFDFDALGITRRQLFERALDAGISLQVHYIPLQHQPLLKDALLADALAGSLAWYHRQVSLPCYPSLSADEQSRVIAWMLALR